MVAQTCLGRKETIMGLSNYQKYSITQHFYDRAKERFGLEPEQVPAFINQQVSTLTVFKEDKNAGLNRQRFLSDNNIIFVCDVVKLEYISCYRPVGMQLEEETITTIHSKVYDEFQKEVIQLRKRYQQKEAKEYLTEIINEINQFQEFATKIVDGNLSERNMELTDQLIDVYHIIRSTLNNIERNRRNFEIKF